jgi:acetyl-CoA carboxylase biotin carboxyl carrier protein
VTGLSRVDVQEILGLLDDLDATELRLRTREYELWLRRDGVDGAWVQAGVVRSEPHVLDPASGPVAPPAAGPAPATPAPAGPAPAGDGGSGLVEVRAPLMGTFYRAPRPGAPPFVAVGDPVAEDTVVGIVETMKLMNAVHAGALGRVAQICLADGAYAEQGAPLVRIRPE